MFRFSKFALALAALVSLGLSAAATAQADPLVPVASRASFNSTYTNRTDITFGSAGVDYAASLTFNGVTFAGRNDNSVGVIAGYGAGNFVLNTTGAIVFDDDVIEITLPTGTTAVAFDFTCGSGTQITGTCTSAYEVYVNGAAVPFPAVAPTADGLYFFGVSDVAGGISTITIRSKLTGAGPPVLDNFSFSPANANPEPVPEPATMVLFGTGLAGVASAARRRRLRARRRDEDSAVG